jgi:hypothetical protein
MELDIFLPKERLAFEYQGLQHYQEVYPLGRLQNQKERDEMKRNACQKIDITLIEIPYWWDFTLGSLHATIYKQRPDLLEMPKEGKSISIEPPPYLLKNRGKF